MATVVIRASAAWWSERCACLFSSELADGYSHAGLGSCQRNQQFHIRGIICAGSSSVVGSDVSKFHLRPI